MSHGAMPPGARQDDAWRGRPAGRSKVGQGSCRPPPIRAGFASPDTPFRVRHNQRELDRAEDAPSTGTAPACAGLPRLGVGAFTRGTACAMHSHSARASSLLCHFSVRPAPRAFFRPDRGSFSAPRADRVKAGSAGPPAGLGLDAVEHGARLRLSGCRGIVTRPSS